MKTFKIKIGNKTKNHNEVLTKLGFNVRTEDKHYVFEANELSLPGTDAEPIDIRTDEGIKKFARHCRDTQQVATYKTKFLVTKKPTEEGKPGEEAIVSSILACTFLGSDFSALVAKTSGGSAAKSGPSLSDLD